MTKRLLSSLFTLVIALGVIFLVNVKASAGSCYNSKAALEYAEDNWDSGVGLCADYASKCLNAGGVKVTSTRVCTLYNELLDNDHGKLYKLKLTNGKNGSVKMSDNAGKLSAGDPIFYYCNSCRSFEHVVICNGANSKGYVQDYAHNKAHNGYKQTYTYSHCGTDNWTLYSVKMHSGEALFGEQTSVPATKITSVSNLKNGVSLKWNVVNNATYYRVYRKLPGGSWVFLSNVTTNEYLDASAQNGKEYTYTVRACKGNVFSAYYAGETVKFLNQSDFKSISISNAGLVLSWDKNTVADGYYLYRQVNNGSWAFYTTVRGGNITSYTDKNVASGNTYSYRIKAFSGSAVSYFDYNGISSMFLATPQFTGAVNAANGINVSWVNVKGATGYRVYRRASGEASWLYLGTVTTSFYTDTDVNSGVYYRYTVRAVYGNVFSGYDANGVLLRCLSTPELKGAQNENNGVKVDWSYINGATGYYVYHKAEGDASWKRIATVTGATSYVDTEVTEGITYIYTVKAFYGNTMSSYNNNGIKNKFECGSL